MSVNSIENFDTSSKSSIWLGKILKKAYFLDSKESYFDYLKNFNDGKEYKIFWSLSNTLIQDEYINDIIFFEKNVVEESDILIQNWEVEVNCGIKLSYLANYLLKKGFDCTYLLGIPWTVGGAVCNNSGSWKEKKSIFENIDRIIYYERGREVVKRRQEIIFSRRFSEFKNKKNIFLYKCFLRFEKKERSYLLNIINKRLEQRKSYRFIYDEFTLGSLFIGNSSTTLPDEIIDGNFSIKMNKIMNKKKSNELIDIYNFSSFVKRIELQYNLQKEIQIIDFKKYNELYYYAWLIIMDRYGKILLQKRDDFPNIQNSWKITFFWWAIEKDEGVLGGLKREVNEELGFILENSRVSFLNTFMKYEENFSVDCYIYTLEVEDVGIFANGLRCNEWSFLIANIDIIKQGAYFLQENLTNITLRSIKYIE